MDPVAHACRLGHGVLTGLDEQPDLPRAVSHPDRL